MNSGVKLGNKSVLRAWIVFGFLAGCRGEVPNGPVERTEHPLLGPGLGNLTYTSGELNHMVSPIYVPVNAAPLDGTANGCPTSRPGGATAPGWGTISDQCKMGHFSFAAMANGYLVTPYIDGGKFDGNFAVWNVSNPRNPIRVKDYRQLSTSDTREAHAFGFNKDFDGRLLAFLQSNHGFQIWDWSNVANNISLVADVQIPGTNINANYVGVWWTHLQFPYVYVANTDQGLFVYDVLDATNRNVINPHQVNRLTNADLAITRVNQVHVAGNLMVANYSEDNPGVSLLDLSDPVNPVWKYSSTAPATTYGSMFNGGRLAMAFKNVKKLGMYSINTDANGVPTGITQLGGPFGNSDFGAGGYINFQDNAVLGGFSDRWATFSPAASPTYYTTGTSISAPPELSAGGLVIDMDFIIPLGNLALFSNDDGGGGALMVRQMAPDTTGPTPNFVSPPNGATNRSVKTRVGLTFTDTLDIDYLNTNTIIVRPVGGSAIAGYFSTQTGIVNFTPKQPLQAGTTYEVVVPVGGVRDLVGNTNPTAFLSTFTTAGTPANQPPGGCSMGSDTPGLVSASIAFTGSCTTGSGLTYTWDFGDGSGTATGASVSHTYAAPKHYRVLLTVTNSYGSASLSRVQTVTYAATSTKPTRSSTIVIDTTRNRVSVVNTDAGTVASINSASPYTKQWEVAVGKNPRTLALPAPNGNLWVVNQDDATITILDGGTGALVATVALPAFSRPYGIAFNPAGTFAYVTLEATGAIVRIDASTKAITTTTSLGPKPRGIAVSSDGTRVLVTRFVSPDTGGSVWEVNGATLALTRTFPLPEDTTTPSSESDGPGLPNYVQAVTITPDGRGAWVPSKKDNFRRGTGPTSDGMAFAPDSRTRTIVSKLDLVANMTDLTDRNDVDNSDLANAVAFNDLGDWAFVTTQGTGRLEVYDALEHHEVSTVGNVGIAPRGLVFSGNKLYVQNFLSRNVVVYDVSTVGTTNSFDTPLATISTQATEPLSAQVLLGKQIFYNAADNRMSREGYTSCATCHLDGDSDGRVWDFTQGGEGVRNTISLQGHGGASQEGPVHWTANFDEIQDFENDIRSPGFGGLGFLSEADFALTSDTLGTPKAGRSAELDALAAYVSTLKTVPTSPYRNADGTMTSDAIAGQAIFNSAGCATCHSGAEMTDSAPNNLHDVGTITTASGQRRGGTLTGFDTPTLIGVWATAPYLHDGSAATLLDVITTKNPSNQHGNTSALTSTQKTQLVAYLQQLDDYVAPPPPTGWTGGDIGTVGLAGSYTINGGTMTVTGAGADITGTADAFQFVSKDLTGDGTITAKITTITNNDATQLANTKAGVMFRDGTGVGAMNAYAMTKPSSNKQQTRNATNGTTTSGTTNTITLPTWVRVTRTGNSFTEFYSTDSTNGTDGTWTSLGAATTIAMAATAKVGLAVTSHTTANLATATFTNVTITQPTQSVAAAPSFDVGSGTYSNTQTVTITTTTGGAAIRYTVDGSTPTSSSALYSGPVSISNSNTTLKAIATASGMQDSPVTYATYTLVAAKPTANPVGGLKTAALNVSLASSTTGVSIYYTTDNSTPTTSSTLYSGPINIASTTVLKAVAVRAGMATSAVMSETYTLQTEAPTASLASGTYNDVQSVTLQTNTSGASIYYTLDGSSPTTSSTLYTGPISITATTTLTAIASKSGIADSAELSAYYTLTVSTPTAYLAGGTYNDVQSTTLSSATSGATIYYTLDGSTPTTSSALYSGAVSITSSATLRAMATKGDMGPSGVMGVSYTLAVSTPTASLAGGTYNDVQSTTLSSATSGATIYYTLDGSTPTTASTQYTGAIAITSNAVLQAIATKGAMNGSGVMGAVTYTLTVATPAASLAGGTYNDVQSTTLSSATSGATIYYTLDGSTPTTASTQYTGAIAINGSATLKAIATKGSMNNSAVMAGVTYTLTVSTPTDSPGAGTYGAAQNVTLTSATPGATFYYTLDGTTPTTASTLYSGAINIAVTKTLKAIATKGSMTASGVLTSVYTIGSPCAKPTFANSASGSTTSTVTISTTTTGATIKYTTDGSTPTSSSATYSTALTITPGQTVKAIATKSGMTDSPVATSIFALPSADAHISYVNTTTNYGTATSMEVKRQNAAPDTTNVRYIYIRFPLTGVASTITAAKVRMYGNSATATSKDITIASVSSITWGESTITQSNMPTIGSVQGGAQTVTGTAAKFWEWDVTSYVQARKTAGDAEVSFVLQQTTASTDGPTVFNSKEATTNKPCISITQ
jgi:Chitobiase/beta-hexosaminidase C-terminal domain/Bacterial Ig-like domain/PKD domain/RoxA-like, cytochrome c-like